jgi:5-methylcytosine-specific restriction endonuclease McrA
MTPTTPQTDAGISADKMFWQADPSKFGAGKIHQIDDENPLLLLCGKGIDSRSGRVLVPGKLLPPDWMGEPTCGGCANRLVTRAEQRRRDAEWEARRAEIAAERREQSEQWWADYNAYMLSPEWRAKRAAVLERDDWLCQGCRVNRAAQVHHLHYPQNCQPGSAEWISKEKLFDLVSVCDDCHDDIHRVESSADSAMVEIPKPLV